MRYRHLFEAALVAGVHTLGRARLIIIVVLVSMSGIGCRTREDAAHKVAREGALAAADGCADAAAVEACHEPICRARCAPFWIRSTSSKRASRGAWGAAPAIPTWIATAGTPA